jgi:hypothetical protein
MNCTTLRTDRRHPMQDLRRLIVTILLARLAPVCAAPHIAATTAPVTGYFVALTGVVSPMAGEALAARGIKF